MGHKKRNSARQRQFCSLRTVPGSELRRIGVLGGTFDPPHNGHLLAAREARRALGLDLVLLTVANDPWQKTAAPGGGAPLTPAPLRLEMVESAVEGHEGVVAEDLEIQRGGPTYTADTLAELRQRHPGVELVLLVGSDVAPSLDTWVRPEEVRGRATIVVMDRPGHDGGRPPAGWDHQVLEVPLMEVAAADLRRMVASGEPIGDLVPPGVAELIAVNGLYRERR